MTDQCKIIQLNNSYCVSSYSNLQYFTMNPFITVRQKYEYLKRTREKINGTNHTVLKAKPSQEQKASKPKLKLSWKTILFIGLSFILLFLYLDYEPTQPSHSVTFSDLNSSEPLTNSQLSQLLISQNLSFDFPPNLFSHQKKFQHYKVQNVKREVKQYHLEHELILAKYTLNRDPNLHVLEHKKFTSCRSLSILQVISLIFGFDRCFYGSNVVTELDNTQIWKSKGNKITFYSISTFRPFYFSFKIPEYKLHLKVHIFGIRVEQNTIVAEKTLSSYHLVTAELKNLRKQRDGKLYLPCDTKECDLSFLYIMVMMDELELQEIEIYVDGI